MAKSKKKAAPKLYDDEGNWVEERGRIKGAIRRAFRLSPQMTDVINAARVELSPALKKNGQPGKKNRVRFRCAICGQLFMKKNIQVDHIETVVPLWKKEIDMTYDEIAKGIFCKVENLQVACSTPLIRNNGFPSCHTKKTGEENFIRKQLTTPDAIHNGYYKRKGYIEQLKEDYKVYLLEKEEKVKKKNERKALREAKEATRIKELKK